MLGGTPKKTCCHRCLLAPPRLRYLPCIWWFNLSRMGFGIPTARRLSSNLFLRVFFLHAFRNGVETQKTSKRVLHGSFALGNVRRHGATARIHGCYAILRRERIIQPDMQFLKARGLYDSNRLYSRASELHHRVMVCSLCDLAQYVPKKGDLPPAIHLVRGADSLRSENSLS